MLDTELLMKEAREAMARCAGERCVFWFDIDFVEFVLINRRYGMEGGNELLRATARFLEEIPEVSMYQRLYSGRFIFDFITDKPMTDEEIIKLWSGYANKFLEEQQKNYPAYNLRICCGICPMTGDGSNVIDIIDNATLARKKSRETMGHGAVVYKPLLLEKLDVCRQKELELLTELKRERFTYYLQPIVDLTNGKVVGAEALARLIKPDGEVIYPDTFLPIMEENGCVIELDFMILRQVCEKLSERLKEGKAAVRTSVNLSRLHIRDENTAEKLHGITEEYSVPPEYFNFELTETLPISEFSEARALVDALRSYNYKVSIDDYGSGYTGIAVWQDIDFDVLKMDKKFLAEDEDLKARNTVLVPNTIELAKKMNISVVCEGVERTDQCESLANWGCHAAQGFLFSQPVPPDEFYKNYDLTDGTYPMRYKAEQNRK